MGWGPDGPVISENKTRAFLGRVFGMAGSRAPSPDGAAEPHTPRPYALKYSFRIWKFALKS